MLRSAVEIWRHSSLWRAWVRWLQFTQEQKQALESLGRPKNTYEINFN